VCVGGEDRREPDRVRDRERISEGGEGVGGGGGVAVKGNFVPC